MTGSDNGLSLNRRQAIIWTGDGIVYRRLYASLGLIELEWLCFATRELPRDREMKLTFQTLYTESVQVPIDPILLVLWCMDATVTPTRRDKNDLTAT